MNKYIGYSVAVVAAASLIIGATAFTGSKTETMHASKYISIDVYELPAYEDKGIHVHYSDKTEFIPFPNTMQDHHLDDNGQLVVQTLNKLSEEGYEVVSSAGGLGDKSGFITKIILKKKD